MSTWEERMSQRARERQVSAELAERAAIRARHRDTVREWTERMPALPGETRLLNGEHAGHLEHVCGPITKCSCGELRNPVSWVPPDEPLPPCEICVTRNLYSAEDPE